MWCTRVYKKKLEYLKQIIECAVNLTHLLMKINDLFIAYSTMERKKMLVKMVFSRNFFQCTSLPPILTHFTDLTCAFIGNLCFSWRNQS